MRGLKEIFGGFTSFFIIIPIIWFTGAIVNNAYLSQYGAFSWDILDWGNFSSGVLYFALVAFLSTSIYLITSINYQQILFSKSHFKIYKKIIDCFEKQSFNPLYRLVDIKVLKGILKKFFFFLLLTIILIIIAFIKFFTNALFIFIFICILLCLTISILYTRLSLFIKIINRRFLLVSDKEKNYKVINELIAIEFIPIILLVFILFLSSAFFFGKSFYKDIPKSLGGGEPIYAQFIFEEPANNFVNPEKVYQILDETNHSFILYDKSEDFAFDLPIDENNRPVIKYYKSLPQKFLFSADIHASSSPAQKLFKEGNTTYHPDVNFESFNKLMEEWKKSPYEKAFFLGDIFEANLNYSDWKRDLDYFMNLVNRTNKSMMTVLGNNDFRDAKQQQTLKECFVKAGFMPENDSLYWYKKVNDEVGIIGLYLPDKLEPFHNDPLFKLDTNAIKKLLCKAQSDNPKLLLVLTHQGFIGETPWSFQYNLDTWRKKLKDTTVVSKWIEFVGSCAKILREFDKDYDESSSMSDIIIISGHYHSGIATRKLDGIDHVVCPGLSQSDRDGKRFTKNMYMAMDYFPNDNKAVFAFKKLESDVRRKVIINF